MAQNDNWTCPYCSYRQIGQDNNRINKVGDVSVGDNEFGTIGYRVRARACLNDACQRLSLSFELHSVSYKTEVVRRLPVIQTWQLLPESIAKSQPDYIPAPIVQDYVEACRISQLSPKASATLSRRCIQGMIRDFTGVSKDRLIDEIRELRKLSDTDKAPRGVTPESIDAIDAIRGLGNIGAHMERNIDHIIDVDPGEAEALIALIEMLFDEWYVARNKRRDRLQSVQVIATAKSQLKAGFAIEQTEANPGGAAPASGEQSSGDAS